MEVNHVPEVTQEPLFQEDLRCRFGLSAFSLQ